ncbi:helix-turn-helix domain-containing protein [Pseudoxanthomonas winnipegensis]|uniref:Helix-turn-helix domain-containing protein n=1 Tax=Pseudoxanthomonas winnipegensis TaxID=2480810 RepID=A0A4Q8M5B8_9GAMM|nr:helix-turn-helix domain-containing protein [Pseudoxanthomonas winnipegensis]
MNSVAENLRELMRLRGISENELSRQTGVPQPTIHRVLAGSSADPRDGTLRPLAFFFKVSVEALRTWPAEQFSKVLSHAEAGDHAAQAPRANGHVDESQGRDFQRRLAEAMMRAGLDTTTLAKDAEVQEDVVQSLLNGAYGIHSVPAVALLRVAKALNTTGAELLLGRREDSGGSQALPQSQPVQLDDWKIAFQLVADFLEVEDLTLPPPKHAEVVYLVHDLLLEGLPRAKVLQFVRAAAA